jgi:hypothetical protein
VRVTVTRNYGETAQEKANELLWHLLIAVVAVVAFLGMALGLRPALVVSLAIPLTLALTLFTSFLIGYTINRVTLFALIFSIGILVDDAIVVVENTYRHLTLRLRPHHEASIYAVDEVGNPTILATLTVIAALLPMAFVSGLMGPYMRPIPVNASIAMFFSLLVAFVVIPWFCQTCYRTLGGQSAVSPLHSLSEASTQPASPTQRGEHSALSEKVARQLLRRYGVVFRDLLVREALVNSWRDLLVVYRRLELKGEVRGGRFVSGFVGEQFALPEAVEALRSIRRSQAASAGAEIKLSACDPLNLAGIILPGPRIPAVPTNFLVLKDGIVARTVLGREGRVRPIESVDRVAKALR